MIYGDRKHALFPLIDDPSYRETPVHGAAVWYVGKFFFTNLVTLLLGTKNVR